MACYIEKRGGTEFVIAIVQYIVGALSAFASIICVFKNNLIPASIRKILVSFSAANALSTCMLGYDEIQLFCYDGSARLGFDIPITVMLSISHLALFTTTDNFVIMSSMKENQHHNSTDNILILLFWLVSIIVGMAVVPAARIAFAIMFIMVEALIICKYITIKKSLKKKERLLKFYRETYLNNKLERWHIWKRHWNFDFFACMLFSYVAFSAPWVINDMREGISGGSDDEFLYSLCLRIYAFNFCAPSCTCIYLKYQQIMQRSKIQISLVQNN